MRKSVLKKLIYSLMMTMILFSGCAFASNSLPEGATKFELVEDNVCHMQIGDIGEFDKKVIDFDEHDKSLTIELTMKNIKEVENDTRPVEVFLVIDNSSSMVENLVGDITRKQVVINSANILVSKLFETKQNAKVGVVSFSSLDSVAGETEGTINDAQLQLPLTNSEEAVANAISAIEEQKCGPRTNIEAGITVADDNFSSDEDALRYIILLTDGVPNNDIHGNWETYTGDVATNTKTKLQEIQSNGIDIYGCMIGLDSDKVEPTSQKTYRALAEEIFGTADAPTITGYYYIPDDKNTIENTIAEEIFKNIVVEKDNTLKNIVIKDYFPQEIVDNFDFSYVTKPNFGTISDKIDTTDNSITWTIPVLAEGEVAKVSYKLKLKDEFSQEILGEILSTNEKVDITAEDAEHDKDHPYQESSDVTPKVKVTQEKPVVAPDPIPQTGENNNIVLFIIAVIGIFGIAAIIKDKRIK